MRALGGLPSRLDATPPTEAPEVVRVELAGLSGLDDTDRAILAFVAELTLSPGTVGREAHGPLHEVGLDDRSIHDVVQVACCFAYMNRLADGTGVTLLPHQYELARELMGEAALRAHLRWGGGEG